MALSSGYIRPDEFPQLSDTRFLISCGPFTLDPPNGIHHDALVIALAIVSGQDLSRLESHAEHARLIYLNGGRIPRDMPGNEIPGPFELSQNFPNPFNSTTTIRFTLPRAGFAKLDIYNILGEHLTTLVAGELSADTHSARWDASSFPGGVYFYRLGAGNFLTTKKMLLAR